MLYNFILLLIGWLYPAYATYNSLNDGSRCQLAWVKYWIVFGVFSTFHFCTECLDNWMPSLSGFKLFALLWLVPTLGGGSQLVYDAIIDPILKSHRAGIQRTLDGISNMTSAVLREVIKMIYHLLVDVVEQCWLMTRNADDIHVTPRLQSAINEVIAELRVARQAANYTPSRAQHNPGMKPLENKDQAEKDVPKRAPFHDDIELRILLAESISAQRMQIGFQLASCEHLAPINSCSRSLNQSPVQLPPQPHRPAKPKRGKRKQTPPGTPQNQQMEDVDRGFPEIGQSGI